MIYYLKDSIDQALVNSIIELNNKDPIDTLYIESPGGEFGKALILIDLFNELSIDLIACEVSSSAFYLFYGATKCRRRILPGAHGMTHQGCLSVNLNDYGKPKTITDTFVSGPLRKKHCLMCEHILKSINFKNWSRLKMDQDIFFGTEQLQEFLDHQKKKNEVTRSHCKISRKL